MIPKRIAKRYLMLSTRRRAKIMNVDYTQLKALVKEEMFTGGGINEPSAPEGVPHRMPGSDYEAPEQDRGDAKANKLYEKALKAREATEQLVEALDEPIFDDAYEQAYKATMCLRKVLNNLEQTGAHPMPQQRVVAPPVNQQRFNSSGGMGTLDYSAMGYGDFGGLEEEIKSGDAEVDDAIEMYERLDDNQIKLFRAYLSGDSDSEET